MKLNEPQKFTISENNFYITPFPAMKAANISGDVLAFVMPVLSAVLPFFDMEASTANLQQLTPAMAGAFDSISGNKCEELLNKLILRYNNVAVDYNGGCVRLTEDIMNELFCGAAEDMFILAWDVIKVNYGGFFKKLGIQSGNVAELVKKITK